MVFYPISYSQSSALRAQSGYTTFVVHTNVMEERDFQRYEQMFKTYQDRLISYTEFLTVEPNIRGTLGKLMEYVMASVKSALVRMRA